MAFVVGYIGGGSGGMRFVGGFFGALAGCRSGGVSVLQGRGFRPALGSCAISMCLCGVLAVDCLLVLAVGWVCFILRLLILADFLVSFSVETGGVGLSFRLFSLDLRTVFRLVSVMVRLSSRKTEVSVVGGGVEAIGGGGGKISL
jgi:hypothetical protein